MQIIHGARPLPGLTWPVATLGTFDGAHRGHQKIFSEVIQWARDRGGESIVLTFSPHPRAVTTGKPTECITSLDHRLVLMERLGIDIVMVIEFNLAIAATPADEFVRRYFGDLIHARGIVVGYNTRFGKDRAGDVQVLRSLAGEIGFDVREVEPVQVDGTTVSSTAIRNDIRKGNLEQAARMLGRRVSLLGTVVQGDGRGRQLGFPTANLDLHHETKPPAGVYAGSTVIGGAACRVLISIGSRPTFHAAKAPEVVEVYVDGYQGDLYGRNIEVQFIGKLRDQVHFASAEELIARIRHDVEELRKTNMDRA